MRYEHCFCNCAGSLICRLRSRTRKKGRSILITVILVAVIGIGLFALYRWEQQDRKREAEVIAARSLDMLPHALEVYYNGNWYGLREHVETYLIMGLDKMAVRVESVDEGDLLNDLQSDFLLLMIVDRDQKTYTALQLNRDTMAEIQRLGYGERRLGTVTQQLALSHTYGSGGKDSCRNTVRAVSRHLYDVPVDHYYAVTMDSIPVLNDLVGGVTVHVDDDLTAADPSLIQGTDVTLHGQQALTFVRARMTVADGTNLNRMNRQRTYMNALYEQMRQKLQGSDRFALTLANTLEEYATSDLITDELAQLADQLKDYRFTGIETVPGETTQGEKYIEFYPDEDALKEEVIRLFFQIKT